MISNLSRHRTNKPRFLDQWFLVKKWGIFIPLGQMRLLLFQVTDSTVVKLCSSDHTTSDFDIFKSKILGEANDKNDEIDWTSLKCILYVKMILHDIILWEIDDKCLYKLDQKGERNINRIMIMTKYAEIYRLKLITINKCLGGCCGSRSKKTRVGGWAWAWWLVTDVQRLSLEVSMRI